MYEYAYTREIDSTGLYNVDNTQYLDVNGDMIHLCTKLEEDIPGIKFCTNCTGSTLLINTDIELNSAQQTTLATTLTTYKAQTGV